MTRITLSDRTAIEAGIYLGWPAQNEDFLLRPSGFMAETTYRKEP